MPIPIHLTQQQAQHNKKTKSSSPPIKTISSFELFGFLNLNHLNTIEDLCCIKEKLINLIMSLRKQEDTYNSKNSLEILSFCIKILQRIINVTQTLSM